MKGTNTMQGTTVRARRARATIAIAISVSVLAACSGGDDDASEPAPAATGADDDAAPEASDDTTVEASDGGTGDDAGPDTVEASAEPASADEPAPPPDAEDGDNIATVTIGDDTWEIDVTPGAVQRCDSNYSGAFWALGGDADAGIELLLPPPDDPNFDESARVMLTVMTDGNEIQWVADPAIGIDGVDEGESQVDDYTINGNSVGGAATFIDRGASFAFQSGTGEEPEPVPGSFSVTCAG